ncbi:MAG: hypothetical protein HY037_00250 [Nitrospirae bacterium]|nr:hypothetical protein [Candidatus Troglogloeales bacterium]
MSRKWIEYGLKIASGSAFFLMLAACGQESAEGPNLTGKSETSLNPSPAETKPISPSNLLLDSKPPRTIPLLVPDPDTLKQEKEGLGQGQKKPGRAAVEDHSLLAPAAATVTQTVVQAFEGLDYGDNPFGLSPPEPTVAAGPDHVVEMVNITGRIFSKSGGLISTFFLNSFFNIPSGFFSSDPRIVYDAQSGRWFASFFAASSSSGLLALAVSQGSDPTGAWSVYQFPRSDCPDFPHIGISDDKVIIAFNAFAIPCALPYLGAAYLVLNKSHLLAGQPAAMEVFPPNTAFFTLQPAVSLSGTTTHYMATAGNTTLTLFAVDGLPGVSPVTASTTVLGIKTKNAPPDAFQRGTATRIDTGDGRLLGAVFRGGSLWVGATEGCTIAGDFSTRACLRLIEVQTGATPEILQDMSVGTAGAYLYYPAMVTDGPGNLHLVFTRSSTLEFASMRVAGRLSTDPLNTLAASIGVKAGAAAHLSGRWGDYFGAAIDPSDPDKVWVSGEYAKSSAASGWFWGTHLAQLQFASVSTATLTVSKSGTGSGTVTSSPSGINCGSDCTEPYPVNTVVTLTAQAVSGSTFNNWGGDCSGTSTTATVTLSTDKSCSATFSTASALPDLVVSSLSAPFSVKVGQAFSVSDTTRNQGTGSAAASKTKFYLSTNSTLDSADLLFGSRVIHVLAAGASSAGTTSLTVPTGTTTGIRFLIAVADGDQQVSESSETNNQRVVLVNLTP